MLELRTHGQPSQQRVREVRPGLTEIIESDWSRTPVSLSPPLTENVLFGEVSMAFAREPGHPLIW